MDAIAQLNAGLVGRYTIERQIGMGGMATVYLARDHRHDRRVALKVLKPELGALVGAERFLSEIRVTANLQHPNLLPLFDSGETAGLLFYVMPYVDGETLRQRLDREKQLPVEEAVRLAITICGALDYAHRHGVIHRDLKPENVLLHDGQPLIADFGIGLAVSNAGGARVTQSGIALGTPQYMSPEQAAGDKTIDARTDVYSAGALAYEMLAGEAPHTGATAQAIIAKLLTEDPPSLSTMRRLVPAHVHAAVHRALQRLPADRFVAAREFADALSGKGSVALPTQRGSSHSLMPWKVATTVLAGVAVAAVAWATLHRTSTAPTQQFRFPLGLPDSMALNAATFSRSLDLSPDGLQVTYVGLNGLFVRPLNEIAPRRLTADPASDPRFSPDGAWVAYISSGALRKVRVSGGAPEQIVDSVSRFGWSSKGTIVFTRSGPEMAQLWRVSESGGPAERFVNQRRPIDKAYGTPSFFPDGETFLVPVVTPGNDLPEIAVGRLSNGEMQYLNERGNNPLYLPDGVLLYVGGDASVMAVSLDAPSLQMKGKPVRVFQGVMSKVSSAELAVAANGTMVYVPGIVPQQLIEIDRTGREYALPHEAGLYSNPRYSRDGGRVALSVARPPSPEAARTSADIWIFDVASPTVKQLTSSHFAAMPDWSGDGRRVSWSEVGGGLGLRAAELRNRNTFWRSADGSDSATSLIPGCLGVTFSPKADVGVCVFVEEDGRRTLNVVQLDSTRRRTRIRDVVAPPAPRISPDGRWVAYVDAEESGRLEVFVASMSPSGSHTRISAGGGTEPIWNPQGGELFHRVRHRLVSTTLTFDSEPRVVRRDTLPFRLSGAEMAAGANYDVSRNGQRFLTVRSAVANDQPIVITRWLDEVRKLLAPR